MIRETILKILLEIDNMTKEDIAEQLKKLILDKDVNVAVGDVLEDMDIDVQHGCVCLPSICIGNKCDVDANVST
jgi:hypothetical protein